MVTVTTIVWVVMGGRPPGYTDGIGNPTPHSPQYQSITSPKGGTIAVANNRGR